MRGAVDRHYRATLFERQRAGIRLDRDAPEGVALEEKVDLGGHQRARRPVHADLASDGRLAIGGKVQFGAGDVDRDGQDLGQDREGVDRGIEDAESAGLPDPLLARVPDAHVLFPLDADRADGLVRQPCLGRRDRGRLARVPGGEQAQPFVLRERLKRMDLGQRRARGFFEHHVAARVQRGTGAGVADLRRRAEADRVDVRPGRQQRLERVEILDPVYAARAADRGGQLERVRRGEGRDVLVAGDLADADERELSGCHEAPPVRGSP